MQHAGRVHHPEDKDSEWIDDVVRRAASGGKRIVGVWADGHEGCELPDSLAGTAETVIAQRGKRFIDALSPEFTATEEADAMPRPQQESGEREDSQFHSEAAENREEKAMSENQRTESFSLKEYMKDRFDDLVGRICDSNRRMERMEERLNQRMNRSDDRQFRIETWITRGFVAVIALLLAMLGLMIKQSFFGPGGF